MPGEAARARRRALRAERRLHRPTAYGCKFWTGDAGVVDWDTCSICGPVRRRA